MLGEGARSSPFYVIESAPKIVHPVLATLERFKFKIKSAPKPTPNAHVLDFLAEEIVCPYPLSNNQLIVIWGNVLKLVPGVAKRTLRYEVAQIMLGAAIGHKIDDTYGRDLYLANVCELPATHHIGEGEMYIMSTRILELEQQISMVNRSNRFEKSFLNETTENLRAGLQPHVFVFTEFGTENMEAV